MRIRCRMICTRWNVRDSIVPPHVNCPVRAGDGIFLHISHKRRCFHEIDGLESRGEGLDGPESLFWPETEKRAGHKSRREDMLHP
jgi:hypothetical protein